MPRTNHKVLGVVLRTEHYLQEKIQEAGEEKRENRDREEEDEEEEEEEEESYSVITTGLLANLLN